MIYREKWLSTRDIYLAGTDPAGDPESKVSQHAAGPTYTVRTASPPFDLITQLVNLTRPLSNDEPFVPTACQEAILLALEGRALRQTGLERETGFDRKQLHRKNGLNELRSKNLVRLHPRLGYYRPDAPPSEIIAALKRLI